MAASLRQDLISRRPWLGLDSCNTSPSEGLLIGGGKINICHIVKKRKRQQREERGGKKWDDHTWNYSPMKIMIKKTTKKQCRNKY